MGGGGESEATRCGTCVVGTPVEPRAHPARRHLGRRRGPRPRDLPLQLHERHPEWLGLRLRQPQPRRRRRRREPVRPRSPAECLRAVQQESDEQVMRRVEPVRKEVRRRYAESRGACGQFRTSPITDAAMARLAQGTKVLTDGGQDKVFQQTFEILPGEKLLKAYACYPSTATGPVIGTLYLSSKRLPAFCSDNPLCQYSPSGQQQRMHYKFRSLGQLLMEMDGARKNLDADQSIRARFTFHLGLTMIEVCERTSKWKKLGKRIRGY